MHNQQSELLQHPLGQLTQPQPGALCTHFPEFTRLKYFYGQMLGVHDFQTEQNYFRDKLKLHNRCLHGYGTVCGLLVEPVPMPTECPTQDNEEEKALREKLSEL